MGKLEAKHLLEKCYASLHSLFQQGILCCQCIKRTLMVQVRFNSITSVEEVFNVYID